MAYQLKKREKLLLHKEYLLELALEKNDIVTKLKQSSSSQIDILLFYIREIFKGNVIVPKSIFDQIKKKPKFIQLQNQWEVDNLKSLKNVKTLCKFATIIATFLELLL